jgi:putative aldouronate transport system permease protein
MVLSTTTAFALSRRRFYGRRFVHNLIIFTMYFHGGLIPYYLLVNRLGLRNTLGALILPFGINTFYMFIMKVYFQNIPESLVESAKIDGANEFQILFRIIMPVSLPIVATFVLFYGVDRWNDWFTGVLFSSKPSVVPLQTFLRQVIGNLEALSGGTMAFQSPAYARAMLIQEKIKQACAMAASIPILFFYPALQRYFMKGILVGAIKA